MYITSSTLTDNEQFGVIGEKDGASGLLLLCFPVTEISGGDGEELGEECREKRGEESATGEKRGESPSSCVGRSVVGCCYKGLF